MPVSTGSLNVCATLDELQTAIKDAGSKLVVVDFYATWCGPCKKVAPTIQKWAAEYTDVLFLKVDVDVNSDAAEQYNIEAMPTFKYFKNNAEVGEVVGASEDALLAKIKELK